MKKLLSMFTALILSFVLAACAGGPADIWPEGFKESGTIDNLKNYYAYLAENVFSPQLDFVLENGMIPIDDNAFQAHIDKLLNESIQINREALAKLKGMNVADGLKSVHSILIEYMEKKAEAYETMYEMYQNGQLEYPGNISEDAVNQANASQIATAYNSYMALNPNDTEMGTEKASFADVAALEAVIGPSLWPRGLTGETAEAAWEFITIEGGIAGVESIPPTEAENEISNMGQDVMKSFSDWINALKEYQKINDLPEYIPLAVTSFDVAYGYTYNENSITEYAMMVAMSINTYNALNPNSEIPDTAALDEVKELLVDSDLWPSGISDADAEAAWDYITIRDNIATVEEEKKSYTEADAAKARENAGKIAEAVNITNMFADDSIPRPAGAPDYPSSSAGLHAKDMLPLLWYWWPAGLTNNGDIEAALDLLDYDGSGSAGVKNNK